MKKLFLYIFLGLIICNTGFARKTGCEGDCENGNGTWTYTDQTIYVGEWRNANMNGEGTFTWANGDIYVGAFVDSARNGQGTKTDSDGTVQKGIWKDSELVETN